MMTLPLFLTMLIGGGGAMKSLYEDLGVEKTATAEQIKAAHRKGVREHHPDKQGCREKFQAVQRAYEVLADPERRKHYDETGDDGSAQRNGVSPEHLIADAWRTVIEQCDPECDLIAVLRETILDAARRAEDVAKQAEKKLGKYELILGRLKTTDGSVLRGVLETQCAEQKRACAMNRRAAAVLGESVKLLDGTSYRHEPMGRRRSNRDTSSMDMLHEILRGMRDSGRDGDTRRTSFRNL